MAEEKKPAGNEKFDDFEKRAKEALDEEADRVRVKNILEDEEQLSERELEQLGDDEGAREHFTPEEEAE